VRDRFKGTCKTFYLLLATGRRIGEWLCEPIWTSQLATTKIKKMSKRSDPLIAAPENECVERIFGHPVEKNLDGVESLHGSKVEQAPFMAVTYGRLTGKPGVCISTLGPGTLNFCFISKVLF
jgi:Thiamine pyrophosphate enzyme, N-terminal TPP binding domain